MWKKFGFFDFQSVFHPLRYISVGRVDRASASGAEDLGLITSGVKPMALILVLRASLLDSQQGTVWRTIRQVY